MALTNPQSPHTTSGVRVRGGKAHIPCLKAYTHFFLSSLPDIDTGIQECEKGEGRTLLPYKDIGGSVTVKKADRKGLEV